MAQKQKVQPSPDDWERDNPQHQSDQQMRQYPTSQGYGGYAGPTPYYGQQTSNTTVIMTQPAQNTYVQPRPWSSGICECGKDCYICCCGFFCKPCLECQVAIDMDESCCLPCFVPGWLIALRTKIRTQENITGSVCNDCCLAYWCNCCALCQLAYEVKVQRNARLARR